VTRTAQQRPPRPPAVDQRQWQRWWKGLDGRTDKVLWQAHSDAGLLDLDELTRRTTTLTARRERLGQEKDALTKRSAEPATENRLRRRLAGFAERVGASLDELDFEGRQRLLRLVVAMVRVTGWRVEIHLKIPLAY